MIVDLEMCRDIEEVVYVLSDTKTCVVTHLFADTNRRVETLLSDY